MEKKNRHNLPGDSPMPEEYPAADEYEVELERKRPVWVPIVIAVGAVIVLLGTIATVLMLKVKNLDTSFPNLYVDGIAVGNMTYAEIENTLKDATLASNESSKAVVNIGNKYTVSVKAVDVGVEPSLESITRMAYEWGKSGNVYSNVARWISCRGHVTDLHSNSVGLLDEEVVKKSVEAQCEKLEGQAVDDSYKVEKETITVARGTDGIRLDTDKISELILNQLKTGSYIPAAYEPETVKAKKLDLQKIYDEIFKEAADAYKDETTGKEVPSVEGVSFDLKDAQSRYDALKPGETMTITLVFTQPKVTSDISSATFDDVLSECHSNMSGSIDARKNNITKACEAVNGTVLMPGDEFSFNGIVGERTAERGYMEAGAYAGGTSVSQYGGGICQMSSTIYGCVLYGNFTITERECHMFMIGYLPNGQDATIDWGHLDLKFVNNRKFPVKIHCWIDGDDVNCEFLGTKENDNYVKIESTTEEWVPYKTTYEKSTAVTSQQVKQYGEAGAVISTVRYVYDKDGNLLNEEFISRDLYEAHEEIILVPASTPTAKPTAKPTAAPTSAPTTAPTEEPSPSTEPEPSPSTEPEPSPSTEPEPSPSEELPPE